MYRILGLAAVLAFLAALFVMQSIRSDIQIQIVATCLVGSLVLAGLSHIAARLQRIAKHLERQKADGVGD